MKRMVIVFGFLSLTTTIWGQGGPQGLTTQPNQTDSTLTAESRKMFDNVAENILKAAQQMPEDSYSFRPTQQIRTFGELIAHMTKIQSDLCSNINATKPLSPKSPATKATMISELQESTAQCHMAFSELSAQNADIKVQAPVGRVTHLVALMYIITHAEEEYGQMCIYLRLKGLIPPTTDDTTQGGAAGKVPSHP